MIVFLRKNRHNMESEENMLYCSTVVVLDVFIIKNKWHSYDCVQWDEAKNSNVLFKYYGILKYFFQKYIHV